jgi:hypothetical protein
MRARRLCAPALELGKSPEHREHELALRCRRVDWCALYDFEADAVLAPRGINPPLARFENWRRLSRSRVALM